MAHDHSHAAPASGRKLALVVGLNVAITIAEVIGGLLSGSLSLISDALHNFSDGIAVVIAWIAIRLNGAPRTDRHTFGLKRAEVVAAVINAGSLVAISLYLYVEAWHRFHNPEPISGGIMLTVAIIGLLANVFGTLLLRDGSDRNMNLRAVYLHLMSDAVSSLGVILGAGAILLWGIFWIDPLLTVLIATYVLWESLKILWAALETIMLAVPKDLNLEDIRTSILEIPEVEGLHHLHLWQVADDDIHFEGHIEVKDQMLSKLGTLRSRIEDQLHRMFEIRHVTLQIESRNETCSTRDLN